MHKELCGAYNVPEVPSVYFLQLALNAYPPKRLSYLATKLKVLLNFKKITKLSDCHISSQSLNQLNTTGNTS